MKTKSSTKKFELIFKVCDIELATDEMKLWKESLEYLEKTLLGKYNFSEITKCLQKEIMICDENRLDKVNTYQKIQIGLLYKGITSESFEKFEECMKLAQLLSQDGFDYFIEKFNYIVFSFPKLKPKYYSRFNEILGFLISTCPGKLNLTINYFLRNIV